MPETLLTRTRVLLVDDETEFLEALSARMETRGLEVSTASDGEEALDIIRGESFDAVVLDLAMPKMDGIETLRALKEKNPELQVILLTGHGNVQSGIQAMKAGAMDFLEKPVKLQTLLEKIGQAKSKSDEIEQERIDKIVEDIILTKGW